MIPRFYPLLLSIVIALVAAGLSNAAVEWDVAKKMPTNSTPLDVAVSTDGKLTFVLTDQGTVQIYSAKGTLENTIEVGKSVKNIDISPDGSKLYVSNTAAKSIDIINVSMIYDINTAKSPIKGPADAPVVIAVFSDFQ